MILKLVFIFILSLGKISSTASNWQVQEYSISNQEGLYLTSQIKILFTTKCCCLSENAALRANHDAGYPDTGLHVHFLIKVNCSQDGKHCKYIAGSANFIPLQKCTIFETNLEKIILHVDGTDILVPIESKSKDIGGTTYVINNHIFHIIKCGSTFYQVGSDVNGIGQYNVSLYGWLKENIDETKSAIGNIGDYIVPGKTMLQNGNLSDFTFRVAGDGSNPWSPETQIFHNPLGQKLKVERVGDNLRLTLEIESYRIYELKESSVFVDFDSADGPGVLGKNTETSAGTITGSDNPSVLEKSTETFFYNITPSLEIITNPPSCLSNTSWIEDHFKKIIIILAITSLLVIWFCFYYNWKQKKENAQLKRQLDEQAPSKQV